MSELHEVEKVISVRCTKHGRVGGPPYFKVRWKGYGPEFDSELIFSELPTKFQSMYTKCGKLKKRKFSEVRDAQGNEKLYYVEKVVKVLKNKSNVKFKVRWDGYTSEDDSFISYDELPQALKEKYTKQGNVRKKKKQKARRLKCKTYVIKSSTSKISENITYVSEDYCNVKDDIDIHKTIKRLEKDINNLTATVDQLKKRNEKLESLHKDNMNEIKDNMNELKTTIEQLKKRKLSDDSEKIGMAI